MTPSHTITVLGGTGKTGRRVAQQLTEQGHKVRAASRRGPSRFDWEDAQTWDAVIEGAQGIYLVPHEAPSGLDKMAAFVDRAVHAGTRRLVLLSAREWVDTALPEGLAREEIVRESGTGWTILRPVWFAQNFSEEAFLAEGIKNGDIAYGTADGRHPFIDAEDIAAVAVAALTEEHHHGKHYALSGPEALTIPEAVEIINSQTGRSITTRALAEHQYRSHLEANYYSPDVTSGVLALTSLIRRGEDAYLSDGVEQALGRKARSFDDYVQSTITEGTWTR